MKYSPVTLIPSLFLAVFASAPMAATPVDVCRAEATATLAETLKTVAQAKSNGVLSVDEDNALKTMETNLKNHEKRLPFSGLPLTECQGIKQELDSIKSAVVNMVAGRKLAPSGADVEQSQAKNKFKKK